MLKKLVFALLVFACTASWAEVSFESAHAMVVDEATGQVLWEKDAGTAAPIASMTKLMTAMVVLDAGLDPDEMIRIERDDLDTLKGTFSGVPVGARISRSDLIDLALVSSDNHAAAALARTYPGGMPGFLAATHRKIAALGLHDTVIEEPTGLSPNNHATARDVVEILKAASGYAQIEAATSRASQVIEVSGRRQVFRNTNRLVGQPGWDIRLSKTGFTREAGRCVTMRLQAAGRSVLVVLMGAMAPSERTLDALNIQRWLGVPMPEFGPAPRFVKASTAVKASKPLKARKSYHVKLRRSTRR